MAEYTKGLHKIADDVWAWLAPDGSWGWSNAGLIGGEGRSALVDTLFDLRLTREMLDGMSPITDKRPITDAVNTHANGDHCFGNELLGRDVRIHASQETHDELHEVSPQMVAVLTQYDLGPVVTPYAKRCFGPFRFDDITMRGPDVTFTNDTTLTVGGRELELLILGPAHTHGDVVIHVPDAGVLFAGDLLFIGGTPIMWAGPVENWIAACDRMIAMNPTVVVPGHGPATDADGIREVRAYLSHVAEQARAAYAAGKGWEQAALEIDLDRFATLLDPERIAATMYAIYRGLDPTIPERNPFELLTAMATWDAKRGQGSIGLSRSSSQSALV
jgi:glyoxylase-like metal-dependent hydrolase (beta-lactamase superfamily II)